MKSKKQAAYTTQQEKPEPGVEAICRDCGGKAMHYRYEFFKTGGVRCGGCGGICDPARLILNRRTRNIGRRG